jgi:hypothetical protein
MRTPARSLGAAVLLAGLAIAPAAAQENQTEWGRVQFLRDLGVTRGVIAGPADSAWRTMRRLVEKAGVPIEISNQATGELGSRRFRAVRRLGGRPLSGFFSCGEGMTGPNADTYHVFITFLVELRPESASRTPFEMQVHAEAVDVPGGRPDRLPCATTGRLEFRLVADLDAAFPGTR